jgi:hypothetical protein
MKFSERIGKREPKVDLQIDSIDDDLRNGLWNVFYNYFIDEIIAEGYIEEGNYAVFWKHIWVNLFKLKLNKIYHDSQDICESLSNGFQKWDYLYIYDFLDFIMSIECPFNKEEFMNECNKILEREKSAYRFIAGQLAPITNEHEKVEIEKAIAESENMGLKTVSIHLNKAIDLLADRKKPDYSNSIKESISAVEAICKIIAKAPKSTLGNALDILKKKISIHQALEKGFNNLYGYTCDTGGMRHALMEEENLDLEDAHYMLISCSAFVNYLIVKANKAGIFEK